MSLVYEQNSIDTDAEDAPLSWPYEERLTKAAQWAAAPGEKISLTYLADFYNVPEGEIQARAKVVAPFKKEVISIKPGPDYADNPEEKEEEERTLGEFDEDGEWTDGEENEVPEGFDEIIGD